MSTEGQLYRDNVPHGNNVIAYGDWSSAQDTITATAGDSKVMYISSVDFIIDDGASLDTDDITIADSGNEIDDIVLDTISGFMKLYTLADKQTITFMKVDATNEAVLGELRFMPPVTVAAAGTFTITPGDTLAVTPGTIGIHFAIRGWEDDIENA